MPSKLDAIDKTGWCFYCVRGQHRLVKRRNYAIACTCYCNHDIITILYGVKVRIKRDDNEK